jgi:hypothetical protein
MTAQDELGQRGYQYKHGDRPLDGYTIERAAGRGGFGEVYYAHSDSGREVALKVVNTYEQVELRGISQCMNLKNPHLVTIFDVKYGTDGRPWVIMEYVAGPSLRDIIDASPSGLGPAKSAFFLREVGKGLTYLHDCGIVHRDLKPGNIFYEDGYVKIGDYGLSKAMSMTRHSGQTVAVGTLHYMAPEIGDGKYDRSIDIYALGALLYEMLTGQVPFLGSSPAEVLLKHLRTDVNLEGIEEPFKTVIRKAMAKNPDDRYRSVQEMVEAVFGSEEVRNSVSQFSPASLTMMAGQAARKIPAGAVGSAPPTIGPEDVAARIQSRLDAGMKKVCRAIGMKNEKYWPPQNVALERDRVGFPARVTMAVGAALGAAIIATAWDHHSNNFGRGTVIFWTIIAVCGVAMLAWRIIGRSVQSESDWVRRLALGTPVALIAFVICDGESFEWATSATLFLMCWASRVSPTRKERVEIKDAFSAALCAFIVAMIWASHAVVPTIAIAAGASVAVNLWAPWRKLSAVPNNPAGNRAGASPSPIEVRPGVAAASPFTPPPIPKINIPPISIPPINIPPIPPIPGIRHGQKPFPAWAIVAIILGTFAIVFGNVHRLGGFMPWFAFVPIVAIVFAMAVALRAGTAGKSEPPIPGAPGGLSGSFSGRSSFGDVASSAAHGLIATIGGVFLVASIILAIGLVVDLPGLMQSSLVRADIHRDIEKALGADWPHLLREFGLVACIVFGWIGLLLTLLGRRRGGAFHLIRAIVGMAIIYFAMASLRNGILPHWDTIVPRQNTPSEIVDAYVQRIDTGSGIWIAGEFLVGWVLLVWPARRRDPAIIYQTNPAPTAGSAPAAGSAPGAAAEQAEGKVAQ